MPQKRGNCFVNIFDYLLKNKIQSSFFSFFFFFFSFFFFFLSLFSFLFYSFFLFNNCFDSAYKFSPNLTELDYPTYDQVNRYQKKEREKKTKTKTKSLSFLSFSLFYFFYFFLSLFLFFFLFLQYLGILLSDWTPETIRDVIERNYKHRTKQRKQNRVRFDIPSVLDNVGGGGSRKHLRTIGVSRSLQSLPTSSTTATTHFDLLPKTNPSSSPLRDKRIVVSVEDFNVTEWLKSLHLSRYDAIFRKSGFDSFAKIQELAMEDLDRMNVKIPRHRNLLLKESSLLV